MFKRFLIMTLALIVIFGGAIGFKLYKRSLIRDYVSKMGLPSTNLNAALVTKQTWQRILPAIGSLRAQSGIDLRTETAGIVDKIFVSSGQHVGKGDPIVQLDDTVDKATLKSALVRLNKTKVDFERDQSLFERNLISVDKFEKSRSDFQSAEALVEETQGIIERKSIKAPFAGQLGIHNLSLGQYLEQGEAVVALQGLDKLYLDINLPEKEIGRLRVGQTVDFTVPSYVDRHFSGVIEFIDVQVQVTTRNVLVRAEINNKEKLLLPGMFANATIILDERDEVLAVPREAVAFSLFGETVYQLNKQQDQEGKAGWFVHLQPVTTGELRDGLIEVIGLEEGQLVARDSQNRLLEGAPVTIENSKSIFNPPAQADSE